MASAHVLPPRNMIKAVYRMLLREGAKLPDAGKRAEVLQQVRTEFRANASEHDPEK